MIYCSLCTYYLVNVQFILIVVHERRLACRRQTSSSLQANSKFYFIIIVLALSKKYSSGVKSLSANLFKYGMRKSWSC